MSAGPPNVLGTDDIASPEDQQRVRDLADQHLASRSGAGRASASTPDLAIDEALALKLARSKAAVRQTAWSGRLAVVFAMWGEQRRLLPRSADNPTGEDALVTKLDQLSWLFDGSGVDWSVVAVDDGDPDDSAAVAVEQARRHVEQERVTVFLSPRSTTSTTPARVGPSSLELFSPWT